MAQIDTDGRTELQNRVRNPLEHLYNKLSKLTVTLDKDYKKGDTLTIDAFSEGEGNEVYSSIYEFLEELDGWGTPGNPAAPVVTIDGKTYQEKP
tara:strand:- start:692 stop:973 length:282 start_codon:yes stop_codon:yes gene_type:complete